MDQIAWRDASLSRRALLTRMGPGMVALTIVTPAGVLTPGEARAQGVPLAFFTEDEARTFEALGDVLVPGAQEAGVANYIDAQLVAAEPKLILRTLDFPAPYGDFYRGSIAALNGLSAARHAARFEACTPEQQAGLVIELAQGNPEGWQGPPAGFFYFVARNDAIDAYYGTPEGFERLQVPYMAHIMPPEGW